MFNRHIMVGYGVHILLSVYFYFLSLNTAIFISPDELSVDLKM